MQGPRSADPAHTRRLPRRAGPPGQSAIRTLVRPPPVQNTRRRPGCPVLQTAPELLSDDLRVSPATFEAPVPRSSRTRPSRPGVSPRVPQSQPQSSKLPSSSRNLSGLSAPHQDPPEFPPGSPEVASEWYPFSLVEKFYSHSGPAHKRVRRLIS